MLLHTVYSKQARQTCHKFWLAADVKTKYLLNGFPYLGRDETWPPHQGLGERVVMRLVETFVGKGRNVTTNSFLLASLSLSINLLKKNNSLVGTINKARRELPPSVQLIFIPKQWNYTPSVFGTCGGCEKACESSVKPCSQSVATGLSTSVLVEMAVIRISTRESIC